MNLRKTVWNSKFQFGENSNLNWGKLEIPKLLLIFFNNLKNSQNICCSILWALQLSCWSLFMIPNRFWIRDSNWKRGQFLEIYIFKITLNFVLKLQKLKTLKLYILTRSTTLLFNSSSNFAYFLCCTKRGKTRVLKSGFSPTFPRNLRILGITQPHRHHFIT